jgi:hypothetical protein
MKALHSNALHERRRLWDRAEMISFSQKGGIGHGLQPF